MNALTDALATKKVTQGWQDHDAVKANRNALVAKAIDDFNNTATTSEPFADGAKVYPEPPAGIKQGDFNWLEANARLQGPDMQARVKALADKAKAEGRTEPNLYEMLELGSMIPGAMLQGAINSAASALTLPGDAASGKQAVTDPVTGHSDVGAIGRALDLTGLMSSGSFAGAPKGAIGSGPIVPKTGERIAGAAVKHDDKVFVGNNHAEAAENAGNALNLDETAKLDEGFVTNTGRYVTREEAKAIADGSGQLKDASGGPDVHADDIQLNAGGKSLAPLLAADFSHAARVVEGLPTVKAPADQWLATLKNKGVKDEELDALNLPTGGQVLTKAEIQAKIAQGTPKIEEVVKGGKGGPDDDAIFNRVDEIMNEEHPDADGTHPQWNEWHGEALDQATEELTSGVGHDGPKYSQYQLPGGENYREILVTTPVKGELTAAELAEYKALHAKLVDIKQPGKGPNDPTLSDVERARLRELADRMGKAASSDDKYRSSHWDEPNVLGHMRVNDRSLPEEGFVVYNRASGNKSQVFSSKAEAEAFQQTLPERTRAGTYVVADTKPLKTLHAEELQSDWHQQGKKNGYVTPEERTAGSKLVEQRNALINKYGRAAFDQSLLDRFDEVNAIHGPEAEKELRAYVDATDALRYAENRTKPGAVPDAPFKKSWPDLLLKRLVKRAVDEGYDAISWTDGATQAERYDLSKQIDKLTYLPSDVPTGGVLQGFKDGKLILSEIVPTSKLPDFVGKEAADNLINNPSSKEPYGKSERNVLEGVGLKVGGEGMKAFYDQELPRRAKKLLGTAVEKKPLNPAKTSVDDLIGNMADGDFSDASSFLRSKGVKPNDLGGDYNIASKALELGWSPKSARGGDATVHFVRLTPEVKARIAKGFPLYSTGVPLISDDGQHRLVPVDHNPFEESNQ